MRTVLDFNRKEYENLCCNAKQVEFLRFSGAAVGVEKLIYQYPNRVFINDIEMDLKNFV